MLGKRAHSSFVGKRIGPQASAVQDAQNPHRIAIDQIRQDKWRPRHDEFVRATDPSRSSGLREVQQMARGFFYTLVNYNRGARIVGFNVVEDSVAILQRRLRLFEPHAPA